MSDRHNETMPDTVRFEGQGVKSTHFQFDMCGTNWEFRGIVDDGAIPVALFSTPFGDATDLRMLRETIDRIERGYGVRFLDWDLFQRFG